MVQYLQSVTSQSNVPNPPNCSLIWVDMSTIGSPTRTVLCLSWNKAEINLNWSLCGAFEWSTVCAQGSTHSTSAAVFVLCPREHIAPLDITAFQCVQNNQTDFKKPPTAIKALNKSYQKNQFQVSSLFDLVILD